MKYLTLTPEVGVAPNGLNLRAFPTRPQEQPRRHGNGSVFVDTDIAFGPPSDYQMIRKLVVDDEAPKYFICDGNLRRQCGVGFHLFNSLETLATALQRAFLDQTLLDEADLTKLHRAQIEANERLWRLIALESACVEEILPTWPSFTAGPVARQLLTSIMAALQSYPAYVSIDNRGYVHGQGSRQESSHHIFEAGEAGLTFDFRPSLGPNSVLYVTWEELRPLPEHGISFRFIPHFQSLPQLMWFVYREVEDGEFDRFSAI